MKKNLLPMLLGILFLPQCTEKTEAFLKRRLVDEGLMGPASSLSVLHASKKPRENEYVVRVSGENLKTKPAVQERFRKIDKSAKGELNLVAYLIGGKWLAENPNWNDAAYVRISDKDGTLIYIVVLSPNESIIFLGYR